jgi:ribonucleotide monophosphatase NagD (HAD superfamily)
LVGFFNLSIFKKDFNMYLNRFQQGDEVSYVGEKFVGEIAAKVGVVLARVGGSDSEVVVAFGSDAYIVDENVHLARARGGRAVVSNQDNVPGEKAEKKVAGPEVSKRKGVGGGKRRTPAE